MSGVGKGIGSVWNTLEKGTKSLARAPLKLLGLTPPKMPELPASPTVDTASQNEAALNRVRARRGVLANIYGGASGGAAPVSGKKLLGQ